MLCDTVAAEELTAVTLNPCSDHIDPLRDTTRSKVSDPLAFTTNDGEKLITAVLSEDNDALPDTLNQFLSK
jgi:hypothetical protein